MTETPLGEVAAEIRRLTNEALTGEPTIEQIREFRQRLLEQANQIDLIDQGRAVPKGKQASRAAKAPVKTRPVSTAARARRKP